MTLKDIRIQFIKQSGRFDLIEDRKSYKDNGADFFIRAGQKFLDTLLDTPKSSAVYEETLTAGGYILKVPEVRAVKEVYFKDSDGVVFLLKKNLKWLRKEFGDDSTIADSDTGTPKYYAIAHIRSQQKAQDDNVKKGILILPRAEEEYTMNIEGLFFSPELVKDSDENWWTDVYAHTLVQAGLYMLERFYRNTQGMQDHLGAILEDLKGIDFDVVEEQTAGTDRMSDSFDPTRHKPRRFYGIDRTGDAPPV